MSDPLSGTGSQLGLSPQQINVTASPTVRFQHVLSTGAQNLNLLSAGGQQFVFASQVSVPGLTQVIPTLSTSNQNIQQSGVTRIVNITPQQRVVGRGALQLANPGNDGRVSFVAISPSPSSGQIRAAAHPTLVTSLASPVRQPQRTNNTVSPSSVVLSSSTQPNHLVKTNLTRKRPKLYENLDNNFFNDEKGAVKRRILDSNSVKLNHYLTKYAEYVAELFFLEGDGNIIDFHTWKGKRQNSQQFYNFLQSNKLDLDDEDEDLTAVLTLTDHENESKQPVSAASSHSPAVTHLNQQGHVAGRSQGSHPESPQHHQASNNALPTALAPGGSDSNVTSRLTNPEKRSPTKQLNKLVLNPISRQHTRQHSISAVYDTSIGSQEQIVEKAKQEAYVVQRVSELQREGLWSEKRLPKVQEPPRNKAHWDYLLEEMVWLAADFAQERKWKKANAKKCAKMVQKYFQDKAIMLKKEEKSQELKLRKLANFMAKEVKNFWANVNKLVEYKQTTRLEEKRKKALDQHLSFIVDQTEKYSSWLAESMNKGGLDNSNKTSVSTNCSRLTPPVQKTVGSDDDFEPNTSSEDDEETIAKEEGETTQANNSDEIERLKQESELPLEDLLKDLPDDYWNNRDKIDPGGGGNCEETESNKSEDFTIDSANETTDDEETLEEQEKAEGKVDHSQELAELEAEKDMDINELRAKYSGIPQTDLPQEDYDEEDESSPESCSSDSSEEEVDENDQGIGLRSLIDDESDKKETEGSNEKANKEINDVAAIAESLQPKGNTLLTTSVVTTIPFLLKHILREYQHIGLDWLVTMFDRKLNGILADEMGLGKTIQTIALLAHLACEKGNWGPHLIIVPTSVMLNWEMELKKWCPAFKILTYYGTQKERKHKRAGWTKPNAFHVCITSYKLVIQDHQSFRRKKWKYLILDEAQNIKNFKSQRWQLLLNFQTQRRLLLTGTPLQNNLMELWSLMHFLMPNVFQSHREFKEWFSNPVTGMIEGNSEYNENIIKRLHKVLRPFLLRRLKTEVEKQLPKKYEHVVMCRLSKRQRYLYDDFMSRAKTKETLASGNLLSVINVLMQLRKVCNHPNLFEVRPIISPFQMEGITFVVASLVARALEYNPYEHVDLNFLNVVFVNLEKMTAYVSYRIKKIKAPRKLIEEIDSAPEDPPRCPRAKIRISVPSQEKKSPQATTENKNILGSLPLAKVGTSPLIKTLSITGTSQALSLRISGSQIQLIPQQSGVKTVASQQNDGMQRGLPVQLVQTSTGRHIFFPLQSQAGSNTVIAANGPRLTLSKTSSADVKLVNSNSNSSNSCSTSKPVNWTSAVNVQTTQGTIVGTTTVTTTTTMAPTKASFAIPQPVSSPVIQTQPHISSELTSASQSNAMVRRSDVKNENSVKKKQEEDERELKAFYIPVIEERLKTRRKAKLSLISNVNECRCEVYPLYGSDLISSVRIIDQIDAVQSNWLCSGLTHCRNVHREKGAYWYQTQYLSSAVKSPNNVLRDLQDVLSRYVFYVPSVSAPRIEFHVSHPSPSTFWSSKLNEMTLRRNLSPRCNLLHPIASSMCTQFPDPRLIQYDCGKLQVLDKLLRKLKMEHHKVLLFTQMTRMLDILEAFLNYHGYIYLRLDGTTKVDQRQVLMERFNGDKRIFCFILSTRSGGIGVNLTGADTVIFYDSDWNPTMDAQAQDRCHRIGQTRDVHIYRLVSEMTVEENILKKANQKRLLGDLAIEGGNFTTAYFKSSTIQDLFNVDVSETDASRRMAEVLAADKERRSTDEAESTEQGTHTEDKAALGVLESALAAAEDETDVQAARTAKAEAAAELAEFDENIPFEDANDATHVEAEVSKAEMEVNLLVEQLTPIERYAMRFVEENEAAWSAEQLAAAEAQIEQQKREWELGRLQALKAEEERRLQEEELDEDLLTYSREDSTNQVWLCPKTMENMPMWCPPTPPQEENDVYLDQTMCFLYESQTMSDTQLPPVYVKKELKRVRTAEMSPGVDGRRAIKMHRKEDSPGSAPRSLFDHPSSALQKMRRDMKMQKIRGLVRPTIQVPGQKPLVPAKPMTDSENVPEWTIHEDWALFQSIEKLQELPLNLLVINPGHTPNWDMVADMVNTVSRIYRSPSQCRNRYESVIVPREEGKLLQDSKKQKKTKSVYKLPVTKSSRPVRTSQLYMQDNNAAFTDVYHQRFDNIKGLSGKRKPTVKPLLVNPMLKNPKHAAVLAESGILYETPVSPIEIATKRAERIAKEKQKTIQALQASSQANAAQALTPEQLAQQQLIQQRQLAAAAATKTAAAASTATAVSVGIPIGNAVGGGAQVLQTVTTTPPSTPAPQSQSIVIASPQQISSVVPTASITTLSPALRQTRPVATIPVGIQEMVVAASQSRTVTNSSATAVVSVAQIQAARIATGSIVSATSIPGTVATVKGTAVPAVTVASGKTLNPAQIQYYRQQAMLRQQQQRLTMRDQQLKVIQSQQPTISQAGVAIGQQKVTAVATVPGVTAVQSVQSPQQKAQNAAVIAKGRQEEMAALMKQQIQRQQKTAVTVTQQPTLTAQILAQAGLSVQTATPGQPQVATLVKTSAGGQSVTIPMTGIAIPQVKATINPQIKTTPGTTQPIRQLGLNYQQLLTKQGRGQATKVAQIAKPGLQTQLIVQSQGGKAVPTISMQHIQQVIKNVQPQHITVSAGQPVVQQGNQVVLAKSPQVNTGGVQTRVIPVSGAQGSRQTIQVVPGTAIRAVPNVTIDPTGRSQVSVSSTLASALTGSIKVAPSSTSTQQAFISQVATIPGIVRQAGVNPVRIQTSTSATGTPLMAVTVQQQQIRTNTQPQPDNSQNQS